jgi:hypothetical protein
MARVCGECGKVCPTKQAFDRHTLTHTKECNFKCEAEGCGKSFGRRDKLSDHIHAEHNGHNGVTYACSVEGCLQRFKQAGHIPAHIAEHHKKVKEFACDQCNKSFGRASTLEDHKRTERGELGFPCTVDNCGRAFNQRQGLSKHMKKGHPIVLSVHMLPPPGESSGDPS